MLGPGTLVGAVWRSSHSTAKAGDGSGERCRGTPRCVLSEQSVRGSERSLGAVAGGGLRLGRLRGCGPPHVLPPGLAPRPPGHRPLSIVMTRVNGRDSSAATNVSGESASAGLNQPPSLNMNGNNESISGLKCQ